MYVIFKRLIVAVAGEIVVEESDWEKERQKTEKESAIQEFKIQPESSATINRAGKIKYSSMLFSH